MNFRKSSEGGGGSLSIQNFILQIFANIDETSVMKLGKKLQYDFSKMRGSTAVWHFPENSSVLEGVGFPYWIPGQVPELGRDGRKVCQDCLYLGDRERGCVIWWNRLRGEEAGMSPGRDGRTEKGT